MRIEPITANPIPRITLREPEAAEALGISERRLAEARRAGEIPHLRLGGPSGTVLYAVEALRAWAHERGSSAAGSPPTSRPTPD